MQTVQAPQKILSLKKKNQNKAKNLPLKKAEKEAYLLLAQLHKSKLGRRKKRERNKMQTQF